MKIALLSDIHANLYALESVLSDALNQKVDYYVSLGDTIFLGLYPLECYQRISELPLLSSIKGNTDANLDDIESFNPQTNLERYLKESALFAKEKMSQGALDKISSLSIQEKQLIENNSLIFCHGSPYSFTEQLLPRNKTDKRVVKRLTHESASTICCGHTHKSGTFFVAGKRIINPGAIGYSFDGDNRASYAIIEITNKSIHTEIRKVEYDMSSYLKELQQKRDQFPLFHSVIYALEKGRALPNFIEFYK
jgi:putative phosphoesterase